MSNARQLLLLGAFAAACVRTSGAQSPPPAGSKVRLNDVIVGRFIGFNGSTLSIDVGDSTSVHDLRAVQHFEMSQGRRSQRLLGAGVGLVVGGAATYAVLHSGGSTALCNQSANQDAMSTGECLGLTALGAGVGAGLGALIGGLFKTERWADVPLDRLRVSLGRSSRSFQVRFTFAR